MASLKTLDFSAISTTLLLAVVLAYSAASASAVAGEAPATIYDYLRRNGLPIGLFPKGITEFSHDESTGKFMVLLNQPCNAKFENQFHYDFNVTGTLSFGRIGDLSGITSQELFLWFNVLGIRVDVPSSGLIYFDVGVIDKQFSLSLFESPPDCTVADSSDLAAVTVVDDKIRLAASQKRLRKLGGSMGKATT